MKFTKKGIALALLIGLSPAAVFVAQAARDGHHWKMSADARERLQEGKIAAAKAALKLSSEQEALWAPVEEQVRASYKARAERRAERKKRKEERRAERKKDDDKADRKRERRNIAERYERMAKRMSERAERLSAFSSAFSPFYASLSDEQKDVIGPVMRELKVAGKHGHRRGWHHKRWHDGGWGKRWHHGKGGHHKGQDKPGAADDAPAGDEEQGE